MQMQPTSAPEPSSPTLKTNNIAAAIEDAQLLLQYAARKGIAIDEHDLSVLIESKFLYQNDKLNAESERLFWRSFTNVTRAMKPVTIQSLRSVHRPLKKNGRHAASDVDKIVSHYRTFAILSLIALLIIQVYLIIGVTAKTKSNELFEEKATIKTKIDEIKRIKELTHEDSKSDSYIIELQDQYKEIEQRQDANYELLRAWNKVWLTLLLKDEFQGKITEYHETVYSAEFGKLETSIQSQNGNENNAAQGEINQHGNLDALQAVLREKRLEREHDIARNQFFLNTLSSEYVAVALGRYILPLLYGLLGTIFFVLRTLSKEVHSLTYMPMTEINYRLRIPTGALAGLTISWFFTGNTLSFGLSGFAVAFLTGYNVELLFFLMDKVASQLTGIGFGSGPVPDQSQPVSKSSGSESVPSQSQPASKE